MKGNILEAMSSAVENASVVVLCLCPEYKDSNACRTEGQYVSFNRNLYPSIH